MVNSVSSFFNASGLMSAFAKQMRSIVQPGQPVSPTPCSGHSANGISFSPEEPAPPSSSALAAAPLPSLPPFFPPPAPGGLLAFTLASLGSAWASASASSGSTTSGTTGWKPTASSIWYCVGSKRLQKASTAWSVICLLLERFRLHNDWFPGMMYRLPVILNTSQSQYAGTRCPGSPTPPFLAPPLGFSSLPFLPFSSFPPFAGATNASALFCRSSSS
mmetsp:Transcript_80301/g.134385  ORF Transcript_80301/g.134385 Transcript_80301/m.134385 type:complete len:218 (+) Transcript_80301:796-1449(+)